MRPTRFDGAKVVGMVAVALLLGAMLAPVVSAQSASVGQAGVVGKWAGYVTWPGGVSSETVWNIGPDGTFSIQTDRYTAVGSLTPARSRSHRCNLQSQRNHPDTNLSNLRRTDMRAVSPALWLAVVAGVALHVLSFVHDVPGAWAQSSQAATEPKRPAYQLGSAGRFNEDWSVLRGVDLRTTDDFWDRLKFIPLSAEQNVWLTWAGP